jgi:hypothetical protein
MQQLKIATITAVRNINIFNDRGWISQRFSRTPAERRAHANPAVLNPEIRFQIDFVAGGCLDDQLQGSLQQRSSIMQIQQRCKRKHAVHT